ncbi:MAG: hypothetical protein DI532_11575 [Azospirillum brasilense]|nr:MAG: hypothetical protein DI532_11575 [Azospirillum brasilense]
MARDRHPVGSTGLGKALILDLPEAQWEEFVSRGRAGPVRVGGKARLEHMRLYAARAGSFRPWGERAGDVSVSPPHSRSTGRRANSASVKASHPASAVIPMASSLRIPTDASR